MRRMNEIKPIKIILEAKVQTNRGKERPKDDLDATVKNILHNEEEFIK